MKTTIIILISALLLVAVGTAGAQNVEFVGSYELWMAWKIAVSGNYAYIAASDPGLHIIDITNPSNPLFASSYDSSGSGQDVFILGGYAYYLSDYASGLQIIDISDPLEPMLTGNCPTSFPPKDVFVSGNYAFVANAGSFEIIDISDKTNPFSVWESDGSISSALSVHVSGDYAYLGGGGYSQQRRFGEFHILNVSDPSNPVIVFHHGWTWGPIVNSVFVLENHAYVCSYDDPPSDGIHIMDVSDPQVPTVIGVYDTPYESRSAYVSGNYAYVTCTDTDNDLGCLQVLDVSDPANPTLSGNYDIDGDAIDVCVSGDFTYVTTGQSLLVLRFDPQTGIIGEVTVPEHFSLSQNYPNPFNASTSISFALPEPGDVRLVVYDLLGRQIETLLDGYRPAGTHRVTFDASDYSSGLYFYRVQAGDMIETKRMVLLK